VADAVRDFLGRAAAAPDRQVMVEVAPVAAQLPPCDQPQPFLPQSSQRLLGRVAVGVHCDGGATRYRQATVTISAPYPVTLRDMAAGEVLSADLLELRHGDLGTLPRNTVLDAEQAIGRELTRALDAGSPLPANALRRVPLVARGARVRVEARAGSFVASREGTALDSGGQGEEVRIRTESGAILRARVRGRNLLTVDF
jgi:flagella basal body P-ring formation protein FlgA